MRTVFGPVHLSSAPGKTTTGLKSGALGSAHSTFPYGMRHFARNLVMYSVVKRNCTAQPKRRHLGEPCELRLNGKFLSCCRERFHHYCISPHELFHIVLPISSVCGKNIAINPITRRALSTAEGPSESEELCQLFYFKAEGLPLCVI